MAYLYSSDRIAQLLGQGVTVLTPTSSGFKDLYEDGVMEYGNRDELLAHMIMLFQNDELRMKIGKIGHRLAQDRTNVNVTADFYYQSFIQRKIANSGMGCTPNMTILYIDADACPVKSEALRVADRHKIGVFIVANGGLRPKSSSIS